MSLENQLAKIISDFLLTTLGPQLAEKLELDEEKQKIMNEILSSSNLESSPKCGSSFFLGRKKPKKPVDKRLFIVDKFPTKEKKESAASALIGDFNVTYERAKPAVKKLGKFNYNLSVGPAWLIFKTNVGKVEDLLKKEGLEYKRLDYENWLKVKDEVPKKEELPEPKELEPPTSSEGEEDHSAGESSSESSEPSEKKSEEKKPESSEEESEKESSEKESKGKSKKESSEKESSEFSEEETSEDDGSSESEEIELDDISKTQYETHSKDPYKQKKKIAEFIASNLAELKKKYTPQKPKRLVVLKKKNGWGNLETKNEGFVVMSIPYQKKGNKALLKKHVIGVQDRSANKKQKGLSSVEPLSKDDVKQCQENKWAYLTEDVIEFMRKYKKDLYHELAKFFPKEESSEDDLSDESTEESSE